MTNILKTGAFALATVGLVAATAVAPAAAKTCWSTNVVIKNDSPFTISIRKLYYYDQYNQRRTDNLKNVEISPGRSYREKAALRKVGDAKLKAEVQYRSHVPQKNGASKWGGKKTSGRTAWIGPCKKGQEINVYVRN